MQDPSNSSAKSIDAASRNTVQSSHPFRVIDNDGLSIHSMQSLGKVGRILSGSLDPASMSVSKDSQQVQRDSGRQSESPTSAIAKSPSISSLQASNAQRKADDNQSQNSNYSFTMNPHTILQEPDVIASTKLAHSKTTDSVRHLPFTSKFRLHVHIILAFRSLHPVQEFQSLLLVASAIRTKVGKSLRRRSINQSLVKRLRSFQHWTRSLMPCKTQ